MIRSASHLKFIRSLPCCKCGSDRDAQAAHVRIGGDGGMGLKPSDGRVVPLCHPCHVEQHRVGERTFWGSRDPLQLASMLAAVSGNTCAGTSIIFDWGMFT